MNQAVRTSRLTIAYRRYLDDSDTLAFASVVDRYYSPATLMNSLHRGNAELRRAAALAISIAGDSSWIDTLGYRLSDPDRGVRLMADDAFRALLIRFGSPTHQQQLLRVMHLTDGAEFASALTPALILADQAPAYAEVHHQLAIIHFGMDQFQHAESAFRRCLWQCRFHYMAWAGLADCRRVAGDNVDALRCLNIALGICPDFESARIAARSLERQTRRGPTDNG